MYDSERVVVVGGTFSPLHNGHRALLHKAFQTASHDGEGDGHVVIGLTVDELAQAARDGEEIQSYTTRKETLEAELERIALAYSASHEVIELQDPAGPAATEAGIDALVVSPEAKAQRRATGINDQRLADGYRPLEIHTPPFIVAEDGVRISATRIRRGEIDEYGFKSKSDT